MFGRATIRLGIGPHSSFICNHGLTQLVNEPTRGNSILDVILCSDLLCCDSVHILAPLANSDHSVVSFNLYISLPHDIRF